MIGRPEGRYIYRNARYCARQPKKKHEEPWEGGGPALQRPLLGRGPFGAGAENQHRGEPLHEGAIARTIAMTIARRIANPCMRTMTIAMTITMTTTKRMGMSMTLTSMTTTMTMTMMLIAMRMR